MEKNIEEAKKWLRKAAEAGSQEAVEKLKILEKQKGYILNCKGNLNVGDIVIFGSYPQNSKNKKEPIEWRVLSVKNGNILIISKYALNCKQYNEKQRDVSWEECTLRKYLNNEFLNVAFSCAEQNEIATSKVKADKHLVCNTGQNNNTEDKIFLLSVREVERYFKSNNDQICIPTKITIENGADVNEKGQCWWWLRSHGYISNNAAYVESDGMMDRYGVNVYYNNGSVRPVLWIKGKDYDLGKRNTYIREDRKNLESKGINLNEVKVGNTIKFGNYPQDSNDKDEPIEWRVLVVKNNKAMLISQRALDCKRYNERYGDTSWEECTLRKWLNNDFLDTAFSVNEKNLILVSEIIEDENPLRSIEQDNVVEDKIFILSVKEVEEYFSSDNDRICNPTPFAIINGANEHDKHCWWWLRSIGNDRYNAAYVYQNGSVYYLGSNMLDNTGSVRPALWINLKS